MLIILFSWAQTYKTAKKNTITSAVTSKEVHIEVNNEECSCMFMSRA